MDSLATALGPVLGTVAPVFGVILLGWLAAARGVVGEEGVKGLSTFAFSFAAPCLLFAGGTAGHQVWGAAPLAFFLGAAVLYAGSLWGARRKGMGLGRAGGFALDATFGNTVMMGIPLVAAAFGQAGLAVLLGILALHSMVLLGTATVVAEVARNPGAAPLPLLRATAAGVLRNPVVMAVLLAVVWSALALPVPAPLRSTLDLVGAATAPVSLFCLGASLRGLRAGASLGRTAVGVPLKLLAMPVLVWLFGHALGLSPLEMAVAVTAAALPTGANAFLLAARYATDPAASGAQVLVSTVLSVATLTAVLALFR